MGFLDTPGSASVVELSGSLAYVADGNAGLRIVDVSDPAAPDELGFLDPPGSVFDVELADGLAWVADGASGLRAIDVSDPSDPFESAPSTPRGRPASGRSGSGSPEGPTER